MNLLQRIATKFLPYFLILKRLKNYWRKALFDILIKRRVVCQHTTRFLLLGIFLFTGSAFAEKKITSIKPLSKTMPVAQSVSTISESISKLTLVSESKEEQTNRSSIVGSSVIKKDADLEYVQSVSKTGARQLALINLNNLQPDYQKEPARWLIWEKERIHLLNKSEQYTRLADRVAVLPSGIDKSFEYWARTQQINAYIKLNELDIARHTLVNVIWKSGINDSEVTKKWLPHWRRKIIFTYLNAGLVKDVHIAITRFRQDYGEGDINDIILYARVLIMNGLYDEALDILTQHNHYPEAGMMQLLVQLRKAKRSPRKVLQAGLRQMQGDWVKPELKIYLWSIVAEAARRSEDRLSGIKAMEFIFSDASKKHLPKGLFDLTVDDLWDGYIENAKSIGNKSQYLVGDDPVWLDAAQAFDATQAINARSLYAFLILYGQDKIVKQKASKLFIKSVQTLEHGGDLLKQLFLQSNYFPSKEKTPIMVRHFLVDYALNNTDIRLASELFASVKKSPSGEDAFMWTLRRARVLTMGGNTEESSHALIELLDQSDKLALNDIDKLMQVVFDLQTVKAHKQAYAIFEKLLPHIDDIKRQREIYYWMADSKKAQTQYAKAAGLYLKSAMLPQLNNNDVTLDYSLDPWGQTARYQAASNLAKAGLVSDARALYTQLLDVTKEEGRIKVLKHELQQLWLIENQQLMKQ